LRKVGLIKLTKFLEKIVRSGHPVRLSQFDIRKRGSEPDSYDVDLVVSAFDRKAEPKTSAKAGRDGGAAPSASAAGEDDDEKDEEDNQ
jgi:general secretion pathway protein M